MRNVIEPSIESLLAELKKRAEAELATSEAAYIELIDDLFAEKIEWGEISENDDMQAMREDLIGRWPDVERYLRKKEKENP